MPASFAPSLPLRALTLVAALAGVAASPSPLVVANATAANATVVYTAAQVGDYQVALWTSIGLAAVLLSTIYFMLGMDEVKDPQLYAQVADAQQSKAQSSAAR